ncbi:hypothetical protein LGM43_07700 [Burkholderia seminalis]|uniref:hypothetical protein n=1 Tax=Burkholderia seminalis TaxID=488731 RepID=UPI001CF1108F|nr:hypothetical protein [Burkholderia seminalis]MCA7950152.1 hypothetical protein [Burkholderia seminalis]
MILTTLFVAAVFAIVAVMHRAVLVAADTRLRARLDTEGPRGDASRRLMRESGYRV